MNREEIFNYIRRILTTKKNGRIHRDNFEKFRNLGEHAPIDNNYLSDPEDDNGKSGIIVLSDKVYVALLAIIDITKQTNSEVPFFLFGREENDNLVRYDDCIISPGNNSISASFSDSMNDQLVKKLNENRNSLDFVVCHGHSHPPIGQYYENFSVGDFVSYVQMNQANEVFKERKAELMGCVLTPSEDMNFIWYDNSNENFYRFKNVYVQKEGRLIPVNSYGLHQQDNYNENSFHI